MHHFSGDLSTLVMGYVVAVVGSLIGLACMARAGGEPHRAAKVRWTASGAFAIGGVGTWLVHFIAMLGFDVPGANVRYSAPLTALSAVVAIVVVGLGLSLVALFRFTRPRLLLAGVLTGLGVAGMHYLGMSAVRFRGTISHDPALVAASCLVAIVAATAALWFTLAVRTPSGSLAAGLIMGVAVTGMHYTGMAAVGVALDAEVPAPTGTAVFDLVFPVFVTSAVVVAVLLWVLLATGDDAVGEPA
ncbi:signal protein [Saccharothrix syringae]|uniref:Signal protein n=2 Tax=Saccharothrix syringae TaxID=103733 RepID=A0A5Q0HFN5_SACSY|nr:signal protein [Saccharothrix syringae]